LRLAEDCCDVTATERTLRDNQAEGVSLMRHRLAATIIISAATAAPLFGVVGSARADTSTCDAYSGQCPAAHVKAVHESRDPATTTIKTEGSSLPFTGGEVALMSIAGLGAIGAGSVLAVGGKRRRIAAA
jgi:hypothetical protein